VELLDGTASFVVGDEVTELSEDVCCWFDELLVSGRSLQVLEDDLGGVGLEEGDVDASNERSVESLPRRVQWSLLREKRGRWEMTHLKILGVGDDLDDSVPVRRDRKTKEVRFRSREEEGVGSSREVYSPDLIGDVISSQTDELKDCE